MKLSRKFVSDYIDLPNDLTIHQIAEEMTHVGNEYDSAEKLINCTNLVIGEVLECENHPDSDHLHVCKVNVGENILDIVCGAPNCRKGLKVIVAMVGAKLPGGEIKSGMIRGQVSNGMLCSKAELGLDHKFLKEEDSSGICELGSDAIVGEDPIKYLGLDDEVIDFELTSNRGDLLSILGMAYELGAIYKKDIKDIDLSHNENSDNIDNEFSIDIQTTNCALFLAKKVNNVVIKESPEFIKNRLIASGIRPINNVVDISNYVMLELGQPLHFYDYDLLGNYLCVRMARDNETLVTLDGQERLLSESDIVIANKEKSVGLAGVMGGLDTEINNNTKNIIIESAIFDNVKIRKTAKKILRSEASNRFEKGLDPKRTYMAIERCCNLLEKYAEATIEGGMLKYDKTNSNDKVINLRYSKVNSVLGMDIGNDIVIDIIKSLKFKLEEHEDSIDVLVPSRRLDITIEEDLIEEIGRMYGMDNIIGKLPVTESKPGHYNKVNRQIKNKMISMGLNETLSYALIPESEVHKYTIDNFTRVRLSDPMSEDRSTLRYSLLYSLEQIYEYNKARNLKNISIFEMGKGFYKENEYKEDLKLACLMTGDFNLGIQNEQVDFYTIKGILEELMDYLGYNGRYSIVTSEKLPEEFHPGMSAEIIFQGKGIGYIGRLHPNVTKDKVFVFEINLDKLLSNKAKKIQVKEISKYPSVDKDVAFIVKKNVTAGSIIEQIKKSGGRLLTDINIFDVYEGENVSSDEKSIAFSLTFSDSTKTLSDDEVMNIFNKIISDVEKTGAKLRDK